MSFYTSLVNPPKEASYWMPIFYYRDPITGSYTPYYPDDYLSIGQSWLCPLSVGAGIMVDYRCVIYDDNYEIISTRDLSNVTVKDDKEFIYNWGGEGKMNWWLIAGAAAAIVGIALVSRGRK